MSDTDVKPAASWTSQRVADRVGGRLAGTPDIVVTGVASLDDAGPADVSFLGSPHYAARVLPSRAAVVLVPEGFAEPPPAGRAWVHCQDPSAAFTGVVMEFAPAPVSYAPGIHGRACVDATASVAPSAYVGPCAVVEAGARIGERSVIGAGCFVGQDARIGDDCLIHAHVAIRERCLLGNRVIIHCNTTIGSDGFGYTSGPDGHRKIPQVGIVQIDDDVEVGANSAIDRARFGRTWIKRGTKIDNLVQIAHNVVIGEHSIIVAQVGISGSTRLGRGVVAAGQAGLVGHLEIGDGAILMAQAGVSKNVGPKGCVLGSPAVDRREFVRQQAAIHRVPKLQEALKALQAEVAELRQRLAG